MTVFVYISRRPKVARRPRKLLPTIVQPSNVSSWKKPLLKKARGRPRLNLIPYVRARARIRLQPSPPQPSNLSWKRPLLKKERGRPRLNAISAIQRRIRIRYQPFPPAPSNLSWKRPLLKKARGRPRLNLTEAVRRRVRIRYQPLPPSPSNLSWKRPLLKKERGRPRLNAVWANRRLARDRYQPFPPSPSNLSWKRPLLKKDRGRLRLNAIDANRRRARIRYQPSPPQPSNLVFRALRRLKLKRARRRVVSRLNPVQAAPVVTPALVAKPRPKIRLRRRQRLTRPILRQVIQNPPASLLADGYRTVAYNIRRKLRRPPTKLNPVQAAPVITPPLSFAPARKRRIKRRWRLARASQRLPNQAAPSVLTGGFVQSLTFNIRHAVRRVKRQLNPVQAAPVVTPALVFKPKPKTRLRKRLRLAAKKPYPAMLPPASLSAGGYRSATYNIRHKLRRSPPKLNPVQAAPTPPPVTTYQDNPFLASVGQLMTLH